MEMSQYLEVFIEESKEHIQSLNENLLNLEKNPQDLAIVNEIFRSAHTLKGMSATMGFENLANLTHKMENVLDAIRNGKLTVTPSTIDVIFTAVDHLEAMVDSVANGGDGKLDVSETIARLHAVENGDNAIGEDEKEVSVPVAEKPESNEIVYDEYKQTVIVQSREQGYNCYQFTVRLRNDCLLKAARVFMVFDILEKCGEIIQSNPPVDQLEEEQFDKEFTVTLISKEDREEIRQKILKVSEIEQVNAKTIVIESEQQSRDNKAEPSPPLSKEKATALKKKENKGPVPNIKGAPAKKHKNTSKTIRVNIERLDNLLNLFEELVIDRGRLEQIAKEVNHSELNETVERMSRISSDLQTIILNMRMVPVETVFNRFPRLVRQLARDLHKKMNLEIIGAETELDRTVIDEIGDPLVHLIRNSCDHGIELPEQRLKAGKPETGTITLKAYHSGNHVFIEIEDDGAGINREKVLEKAIQKGIVKEEEANALTDSQIFNLIFESGFSTADKISDISGRGVGLDVVKSTIQSLGGSISVHSEEGRGSIFTIQLPLTLSIISVMLVEIGSEKYAVPLTSIVETAIIKKDQILNAHHQKVIDFRGKVVPLVFLNEVFEVTDSKTSDELVSVLIVRKGEKMAAFVVDSFIGQQEIVLKSLGNYLTNVFAISGATILGDGQVALIIDCNVLIK
ncbi:chemotaxis protein CheA [Weizmannia acidilactici]|uniref:Chemotaxis protein CheA n=1 Tax=Weizmannia acidilactici TaxID=2607726 RepID=A0A5J4J253_9BACI|nr:chemotaxis protein CheA [Weizmannia acidilactici]GER65644.1 chemotaxis protein CheA [Weizmannia acidilactici]GER69026.1 chemotaxis protein CheA [Weizmannia acidilactici]GER72001.1 chemotaxis protein CheA [Weizmannia acidilactici]